MKFLRTELRSFLCQKRPTPTLDRLTEFVGNALGLLTVMRNFMTLVSKQRLEGEIIDVYPEIIYYNSSRVQHSLECNFWYLVCLLDNLGLSENPYKLIKSLSIKRERQGEREI